MAILHHHQVATAVLLLALVFARVEFSACHVLKGSLTCLDCNSLSDLSDIKVLVQCSQVKKLAVAMTTENGAFETELPSDGNTAPSSVNCHTKILGGPTQLYASRKNMVSKAVRAHHSADSYTISTPLHFYTSCPVSKEDAAKCGARNAELGSSKTVNVPVPPEWGLPPASYYVPFMPIIGIP